MDDSLIVDLFLQRDESAIEHTADKFGSRLRTLSYRIVEDYSTAEECENDTYIQAWNSIPPHEPKSYLYAFLARITRNISLNCCRDRNRLKRGTLIAQLSDEMEACIPAPSDSECRVDDIVLKDALNTFLGNLDAEKRNIFIRRYWYMDSIADICQHFALSESRVKITLHRCRNKLRQQLLKEGYTL